MDSNNNAQAIETSVNVISNSRSQDYIHPEDHTLPTYEMYSLSPSAFCLLGSLPTELAKK